MRAKYLYVVVAVVLVVGLSSCAKKETKETTAEMPAGPAATPIDLSTVGDVAGTVRLEGKAPAPKRIRMDAEPNCSKMHTDPVYDQEVVTGDGGALANVIVYVKEGLGNRTFNTPTAPIVLDQKGCLYQPHVIALMAGQPFEVINSDPTTHNIHPLPKDNREWNRSQPPGADAIKETFARAEMAIPVKCNVHPWMKSYVAVFKNPYFQVTGKSGSFDLKNLPPGTYTIAAWQEKYGTVEQQVTLGPKESKKIEFVFKGQAGD